MQTIYWLVTILARTFFRKSSHMMSVVSWNNKRNIISSSQIVVGGWFFFFEDVPAADGLWVSSQTNLFNIHQISILLNAVIKPKSVLRFIYISHWLCNEIFRMYNMISLYGRLCQHKLVLSYIYNKLHSVKQKNDEMMFLSKLSHKPFSIVVGCHCVDYIRWHLWRPWEFEIISRMHPAYWP